MLDALDEQVRRQPDAPVFSELAPEGSLRTMSFRQLDTLAQAGAAWMVEHAGVVPGRPIALLPVNDLRSIVAVFAGLRLGSPMALLDPFAPAARQAAIVRPLGIEMPIHTSDGAQSLDGPLFPDLPDLPLRAAPRRSVEPGSDMFYIATSGSTASSKIVAQSHRAATANALAVQEHHRLGPGDRFLGCLPIHHVNGLHFTVMAAVVCGFHALLPKRFDPFQYPRLLESFRPHVASVVPSILQALRATWRAPAVHDEFRYFVSAAAPLPRATAQAVWDDWRARVVQGYGLTETINFSATMPRDLSDGAYARLMLESEVPPIGIAVAGNELAILRPDGEPVRTGEIGELCVRGHNVMDRYVGNAEATAEAFRHGWFCTGDLARWHDDERVGAGCVVIAGRSKNIAKVRGESVSLEEMERHLLELPAIRDAACTALADPVLGEAIIAAIDADAELNDASVLDHLRRLFPEAAMPRHVVRLPAIPRTSTGKLLRPQLRERLKEWL